MNLRVGLRTSLRWLLEPRHATSMFDRAVGPRPSSARPPATLEEAIGDEPDAWTGAGQARIRARLELAAEGEFATAALRAYDADPDRFLRLHFEAVRDHATTVLALMRATATLCKRADAKTLSDALTRLGISEADWLGQSGLALFDRDDGISTMKEQTQ